MAALCLLFQILVPISIGKTACTVPYNDDVLLTQSLLKLHLQNSLLINYEADVFNHADFKMFLLTLISYRRFKIEARLIF